MKKSVFVKTLKDVRHHLGWGISTAAISGTLYLSGTELAWYQYIIMYVVMMLVDAGKHTINLQ